MANVTLQGNPVSTCGELPRLGTTVSIAGLVRSDLSDVSLAAFAGKRKILSFFPSVDTGTCAASVRRFNTLAAALENTVVLNVSVDLPFAQARFCGAEGIKNCEALSAFRSTVGRDLGLEITQGPLAHLLARAVVVLSATDQVLYTELVPEITAEPNYAAAIAALTK